MCFQYGWQVVGSFLAFGSLPGISPCRTTICGDPQKNHQLPGAHWYSARLRPSRARFASANCTEVGTQTVKGKGMIWFETGRWGDWWELDVLDDGCFYLFKTNSFWVKESYSYSEWVKTENSKRFEEGEILFQTICWISVHHITPEEKKCELPTRNSWVILGTNIQWSTWRFFSAGGLGISRPLASTLWRRSTQIGGQSLESGLGMWDGDGLIIFFSDMCVYILWQSNNIVSSYLHIY